MLLLVVSDFHLGKGRYFKNGEINLLEDFEEDVRFGEFVDFYCTKDHLEQEVHLVLNGDFLNLLQIETYGVFSALITEKRTLSALSSIQEGHQNIFLALKKFIQTPKKKLTYIIGNHDAAMYWPKAQEHFCQMVGGVVEFALHKNIMGVHIEHGHRFEAINNIPTSNYYTNAPNGDKILNLPWGGRFCIEVLPALKKERPYLDKIRPVGHYVRWCFFHDFRFFLKMANNVVSYFMKSGIQRYLNEKKGIIHAFWFLKNFALFPQFSKKAKKILTKNKHIHTVILGHTHISEWRKFPDGKLYFNTGTWNTISSLDSGLHQDLQHLTYVYMELNEAPHGDFATIDSAGLYQWYGHWTPFREEVKISHMR